MRAGWIVGLVGVWVWVAPGGAWAASGPISLAVFQADATPPAGSPLCHGSIRPVTRIADPLGARGVVLLGADKPIVLCAVDWVGIGNGGHTAWRTALAAAAGTTPERVAVHTVHQHDSPACDFSLDQLLSEYGLGGRAFNVAFAREAIARTAEAVRRALAEARPISHVGIGQAAVDRVASTRRVLGADGKVHDVRYSTCTRPALVEAPEGLVDPVLRQVSFWDGDEPVAVLTYYACHPVTVYGKGAVSADIAGLARGLRDFFVPAALHVYFAGAGGDLAPGKYNQGRAGQRLELAGRLADAMERAWVSVVRHPVTSADVAWRVRPTRLPLRAGLNEAEQLAILRDASRRYVDRVRAARNVVWMRRAARGERTDLTCLRVGPAWIVHLPGEAFVAYQVAAQRVRPGAFVCVAAYGEYGPGYVATAAAYGEGGYEVGTVSRVGPEAEAVLRSALGELLQ